MWWFRWHARRFFRSVMSPMDKDTAILWERRMRFTYIFIGLNAMIVGYRYYSSRREKLEAAGLVIEEPHAYKKVRQMTPSGSMTVISAGWNRPTEVFQVDSDQYRKDYERRRNAVQQEYLKKKALIDGQSSVTNS